MTRFEAFKKLLEVMKDPNRIGEIPIYKSEIGGIRAAPHIEEQLGDDRHYFPPIDLERLRALPEGAFGREYARFLDENGLNPIVVPDTIDQELLARNAFNARYGVIHDMCHVLTIGGERDLTVFTQYRDLHSPIESEPRVLADLANVGHFSFTPIYCVSDGDGCGETYLDQDIAANFIQTTVLSWIEYLEGSEDAIEQLPDLGSEVDWTIVE